LPRSCFKEIHEGCTLFMILNNLCKFEEILYVKNWEDRKTGFLKRAPNVFTSPQPGIKNDGVTRALQIEIMTNRYLKLIKLIAPKCVDARFW